MVPGLCLVNDVFLIGRFSRLSLELALHESYIPDITAASGVEEDAGAAFVVRGSLHFVGAWWVRLGKVIVRP